MDWDTQLSTIMCVQCEFEFVRSVVIACVDSDYSVCVSVHWVHFVLICFFIFVNLTIVLKLPACYIA